MLTISIFLASWHQNVKKKRKRKKNYVEIRDAASSDHPLNSSICPETEEGRTLEFYLSAGVRFRRYKISASSFVLFISIIFGDQAVEELYCILIFMSRRIRSSDHVIDVYNSG
jgi:hypothetical protein